MHNGYFFYKYLTSTRSPIPLPGAILSVQRSATKDSKIKGSLGLLESAVRRDRFAQRYGQYGLASKRRRHRSGDRRQQLI